MNALEPSALALRDRRIGWSALLVFLALGLVLETLHGFKIGFYPDGSNEVRRHLWTLAPAHGALLGLVHLGLAATMNASPARAIGSLRVASAALGMAMVLRPDGFLLGGGVIHGGGPGLGIVLVPVGGLCPAVAFAAAVRSPLTSIG